VCVCAFSLHRESPDIILGDKLSFLRWFCHNRQPQSHIIEIIPQDFAPDAAMGESNRQLLKGIREKAYQLDAQEPEKHARNGNKKKSASNNSSLEPQALLGESRGLQKATQPIQEEKQPEVQTQKTLF
jgi:hypothetical protein